eukprot:gene7450-10154_t
MLRKDLRSPYELRPITPELGVVHECDGSASLRFGNSMVLTTVTGPTQPKFTRQEFYDCACLEVEVDISSKSKSNTDTTSQELSYAKFIKQSIINSLELSKFPRLLISIRVLIISDDGSVLACAINATVLALLDAALPMRYVPNAVTLSIIENNENDEIITSIIFDPTKYEENISKSVFIYVINPMVISHNNDNKSTSIICSDCLGQFSIDQLSSSIMLASKASYALKDSVRTFISDKYLPSSSNEEEN